MLKSTECVLKKCIDTIHDTCEDLANGNIFGGKAVEALFESVTRIYGPDGHRGFDPIGIGMYIEQRLKQTFEEKNESLHHVPQL